MVSICACASLPYLALYGPGLNGRNRYLPNGTSVGSILLLQSYSSSYHAIATYGAHSSSASAHHRRGGRNQYPPASAAVKTMHLMLNEKGRPG